MNLLLNLFLFVFGSVGLTFILVDSEIAEPIRNFAEKYFPWKFKTVFHCYLCTGVWAGFFIGSLTVVNSVGTFISCGFTTGIISMFAAAILNLIEAKTIVIKN
jgi:hypothetical protein